MCSSETNPHPTRPTLTFAIATLPASHFAPPGTLASRGSATNLSAQPRAPASDSFGVLVQAVMMALHKVGAHMRRTGIFSHIEYDFGVGATMSTLSDATRDKLKKVSTATICTALFKRGLHRQFIQDVRPLNSNLSNMVGEAFTLRYIPAREDLNPISVFQNRAHPQRKAIEDCPPGAVMVIDSRKDARAASAGSILISRLMMRGVAGVVTDGGFRDSPEIAKLAIPTYHSRPSAPTNLTLHQAIDIDVPIGCGDAPVWPGDVVVGDGEGVVIIPAGICDEVANEAFEMTAFEDFVTEKVLEGRSILGLYPATDEQTKLDFAASYSISSLKRSSRKRSPPRQIDGQHKHKAIGHAFAFIARTATLRKKE